MKTLKNLLLCFISCIAIINSSNANIVGTCVGTTLTLNGTVQTFPGAPVGGSPSFVYDKIMIRMTDGHGTWLSELQAMSGGSVTVNGIGLNTTYPSSVFTLHTSSTSGLTHVWITALPTFVASPTDTANVIFDNLKFTVPSAATCSNITSPGTDRVFYIEMTNQTYYYRAHTKIIINPNKVNTCVPESYDSPDIDLYPTETKSGDFNIGYDCVHNGDSTLTGISLSAYPVKNYSVSSLPHYCYMQDPTDVNKKNPIISIETTKGSNPIYLGCSTSVDIPESKMDIIGANDSNGNPFSVRVPMKYTNKTTLLDGPKGSYNVSYKFNLTYS